MKKLILTTIILAASTTSGQAASFNCNRAALPAEITICQNYNLGDLDVNMAGKYNRLKRVAPYRSWRTIKSEQRSWLRARNRCRYDSRCLTGQYTARIRQLRFWLQDLGY